MGFDFLDFGFPKSGTDWKSINGKPYITVSAKGRSNGLSTKINDGADFGPDTMLNATSPNQTGPPYTQTTGINEAISYAGSQGLGKIVFGEGTFYLNNYISNPYSNMVFIGQGIHKTVITNNPNHFYFPQLVFASQITIEDMDIIANASSNQGSYTGLYLAPNGTQHIIYKSCYFSSPGCQVGWVTGGLLLNDATSYNSGLSTAVPYDVSFIDCIFDGKNPYATSPNFGSIMGVDIKFFNCLFTSTESLTITNPVISYGLSRPNYDGPQYFIGCTFDTPNIFLKIEQGYATTVVGCSFIGDGAPWINSYENIDYSTYEAPDIGIKIIGNEFSMSNNGGSCIDLNNSKGDQSITIIGNHFINTSSSIVQGNPPAYPIGIVTYYSGPIEGIEITNNTFDNMGQGIWLDNNATSVGQISHNIFNQSIANSGTMSAIFYNSGGTGNYIIKDNYNNGYSTFFGGGGVSLTFLHIIEKNYGTGLPYVPSTPTVPASGTAQQNTNRYAVNVYLYGGTVTEIQITKNGTAYTVFSNATGLALSGQVYKLNPSDSITITYTSAPTWEWLSD